MSGSSQAQEIQQVPTTFCCRPSLPKPLHLVHRLRCSLRRRLNNVPMLLLMALVRSQIGPPSKAMHWAWKLPRLLSHLLPSLPLSACLSMPSTGYDAASAGASPLLCWPLLTAAPSPLLHTGARQGFSGYAGEGPTLPKTELFVWGRP